LETSTSDSAEPLSGERRSATFTSRGVLKVHHAATLFEALEREVARWNAEHLLYAPCRVPWLGTRALEVFRPSELQEVPWVSWEYALLDGVHNLRVGLDMLAKELAALDGAPRRPKDVSFPITSHENEWPTWADRLQSVPCGLLERLKECQPWARPERDEPDVLTLLTKVDNHDKHEATGVALEVIPVMEWALRDVEPLPEDLRKSLDWPLEGWMDFELTPPLERGYGQMMPVAALPVIFFEGLFANLFDAQRWLHFEVTRVIHFVASGEWSEETFPQVLPGPVWLPIVPDVARHLSPHKISHKRHRTRPDQLA